MFKSLCKDHINQWVRQKFTSNIIKIILIFGDIIIPIHYSID